MVQGILRTLGASVRGLHQAAYLLAALTLAAQILALLRDRIFAHAFGAGETLDLYYAAFRVPDLVFAIVASLVSAYVLIPHIAGANKAETRRLLSNAATFLVVSGGLASIVLYAYMPQLLTFLFPSLMHGDRAAEFISLSRILLLQPLLLGLSGILASVTQVSRRFMLFALSPVLYNLGIIIGVVFFYPVYGLEGVGAGVVLGSLAHLAIHIPVVRAFGTMPRPTIPSWKELWPIIKESVPRSLALGLGAVTTLLLATFAARTGEGSLAVFTLAGNLEAVPLALVGASYATAAFPVLAEEANGKRNDAFKATLLAAARHLLFWSAVISVLTIVLRAHIVRTLLGTGAFDWDATRLTAALIAVLVIGLAAQCFTLLASRAFYASQRSWNPLMIQLIGIIVSVGTAAGALMLSQGSPEFRYFVEALLRIEDVPGSSVVFIALGATVGQLFMGIIALLTLGQVAPGVAKLLGRPLFEGAGAGIVGGACAYIVLFLMGNIAPLTTLLAVFTQGLVAGIVGLAASVAVLIMLENKEFHEVYGALKRLTSSRALPAFDPAPHDRTDT
mgnify:CR=1 FL=1